MTDRPQRMLTVRSGGWVLVAAILLALAVFVWAIAGAITRSSPLVGDGTTVASYGFDLGTCLVDRSLVVAAGMRKDALAALDDPPVIPGTEVDRINAEERGKYLVSSDRVIGVVIDGEARAYPLLVMNNHEICNDTLGGVPIAVTYNPLCDSVVVVRRRVAGATLRFGVSGLLYNSNLLMYDRRPQVGGAGGTGGSVGESLWCQLLHRAIAGPMAGTALEVVGGVSLLPWNEWMSAHPDTTVLDRDPRMIKRYEQMSLPYQLYLESDELKFPVRPLPPPGPPGLKARVVAAVSGSTHAVWATDEIARRAGDAGVWETSFDGTPITFTWRRGASSVGVSSADDVAVIYALWFAWHAMYPNDGLVATP